MIAPRSVGRGVRARCVRLWTALHRDESGTSDVEYVLLTLLIVLPLLVVPPLIIDANVRYFERVSSWMSLPYP